MQKFEYQYGTIYLADVLTAARQIESNSVDCVITSPPYWMLRDYGFPDQWGLEPTYKEYLAHLQELMTELWRIVKPQGTVWINLGDSYSTQSGVNVALSRGDNKKYDSTYVTNRGESPNLIKSEELPSKCLMLIPHRFAIDCIDNGWILRNDIIWAKPNGMPESVTDRFSKKHEFMFFFVKQQKYYFDLDSVKIPSQDSYNGKRGQVKHRNKLQSAMRSLSSKEDIKRYYEQLRNPGDVSDFWGIPTKPSSNEHYASYNLDLIKKPILAGCPENGIIYDPFMGTATTAIGAMKHGRRFIGSEGSAEYMKIANSNILETEKQIAYAKAQQKMF